MPPASDFSRKLEELLLELVDPRELILRLFLAGLEV